MFEELLDVKCECGKTHTLTTRDFVVEPDALAKLPGLLDKLGLQKNPLAVMDANTHRAAYGRLSQYLPDVAVLMLEGDEIHPDETQIDAVAAAAPGHSVLLAVGSGVINDVCRYVAHQQDIPFISVPTAASVDGFVANCAVVTLKGAKKTLPAVAPVAVVADLDIIANAPMKLTASGVGDMLSKYISAAEWHVGHMMTDEYYCPFVGGLARRAIEMIVEKIDSIANREASGTATLVEGLLVSGLAIQMTGVTRPASSFEHHFSHYLELVPVEGDHFSNALHGEKVGIASVIAAKYYPIWMRCVRRIIQEKLPNRFDVERAAGYYAKYVPGLVDYIREENTPSISYELKPELLEKNYDEIMKTVQSVPSAELMRDTLKKVGGYSDYREIGITRERYREIMKSCCYIRNRFTTLRLVTDYRLYDFNSMDD